MNSKQRHNVIGLQSPLKVTDGPPTVLCLSYIISDYSKIC